MAGTWLHHRRRGVGVMAAALGLAIIATPSTAQSPSPSSDAPAATLEWASRGDPDDPMHNASGVTIAPDGRIWVTDSARSRFGIFDPDGTFVEYWGTEGDGPGEFVLHRPNGDGFSNVAFAPDGSFYVLDAGTREIVHFAADRSFLGEWGGFGGDPGLFANPLAIDVDRDGTVLVVDDVRNVVERLAPDGTPIATFEAVPQFQGTAARIALGPDGDIYVTTCCNVNTVRRYDPTGTLRWVTEDFGDSSADQATGLDIDDSGRVFVGGVPETRPDRIRVIAPDGTFLTRFGGAGEAPDHVAFPFNLALDGKGALYATDYIDGSLKKLRLGPELAPGPSAAGVAPAALWSGFKGDATRRAEGTGGPKGAPVLRWRFQANGSVPENVSIAGDLAYASSDDGVLHALDIATGEERWSYAADEPPLGGPMVDGAVVYVFDAAGILHALDAASGEPRWRAATPVVNPSSTTAGDGSIYAGSDSGDLVAIDASDGTERWRAAVSDTGGLVQSPAYADGRVYVTSPGTGYAAVDSDDGSIVWRFDTGELFTGTAVMADGLAYVGGAAADGSGMIWALDAATGAERWKVEAPLFTPAVSGGLAYSGSEGLGVHALDTSTGARRWTFPVQGVARPLAVAEGVVYVPADTEHRVYALDALSGAELWRFDVDSGIDCCIAVGGGAVYVGTFLGGVYAIAGDAATAARGPGPV